MPVKANWQNGEQFNASDANDVAAAVNAAYVKPGTGIPATDLASAVQVSIGKANTAIQSVASTDITDATTTGKAVLTAASGSAARTAIGVSYGTTAGTVVEGNDSRLSPSATSITDSTAVGRSVLTAVDAPAARTAIGVAYGTTSGTVAQGNDSRITGAEQAANKGQANGYASLDSGGKVPVTQLPNSIMEYQGVWDASTNTPTLDIGSGNTGDVYRVSVGGTINLGTGAITFDVGDYIIRNAAGSWEKSDTTDAVASVAGRTGNVTLTVADIGGNTSTALGVGTVELGHASDTTISRTSAGKIAVEGVDVLLNGGALGTPSSGTLTSCSGLYASTITNAGTTTLNFSSARTQVFTGATTQTVVLPSLSVPAGADYRIINNSTGAVTVQASGGGTVAVLPSGTSGVFVAAVANPTGNVLATGDWAFTFTGTRVVSGKVLNVSNSLTLAGTDGTTMTFPSTSGTVVTQGSALGTPASGNLSNCTNVPTSALVLNSASSGTAFNAEYCGALANNSFIDLPTTSDQVTVTIGASGKAMVFLNAYMHAIFNSGYALAVMSFGISGATSIVPEWERRSIACGPTANTIGGSFLITGLNQGSHTFKAKYGLIYGSAGGQNGYFQNRTISVIPL